MSFLFRPRLRIPSALSLVISLLTISLIASAIPPASPVSATTCANDGSVSFYVSGSVCVGVITSTSGSTQTFTAPSDWNNSNNEIEAIGAGGNGANATANGASGGGGGGGAYASTTNVTVSGTASFQLGAAGSALDTWFGSTGTVDAGAGGNASGSTAGTAGTVKAGHGFSGGAGGAGGATARTPGGGGGGAAGPGSTTVSGTGGNGAGGGSTSGRGGGGGGGAGGTSGIGSIGSSASGTTGGSGGSGNGGSGTAGTGASTASCTSTNNGSGGGGSGGGLGVSSGTAGNGCSSTNDVDWTINGTQYGSSGGGGGGGSNSRTSGSGNVGGNGGSPTTYGGGGGGGGSARNTAGSGTSGDLGLIVITYTPIIFAPTVTTNSAETFTPTTATLFGAITNTGGADATQSGFAYATNSTLSSGVSTTTLGSQTGTASFNGAISSLSANTTYYYRAYATNSAGTGYGSILSFTTGDTTPARKLILFQGYKIKIYAGNQYTIPGFVVATPVTIASVTAMQEYVGALSSSAIAVEYEDQTNSPFPPKVAICTISGTTPTCGTPVTIASVAGGGGGVAGLSSSAVALVYGDETNSPNPPKVAICSISGTTPTCGTPVTIDSVTGLNISVAALSSSAIAVAYGDGTNSPNPPKVAICSISGTTPTCGTPVTVASVLGTNESISALSSSAIAVEYEDGTNSDKPTVAICTVSGTTPTCGTPVAIASIQAASESVSALSSSVIAVAYGNTNNPFDGDVAICTVAGTTPTCGTPVSVTSPAVDSDHISVGTLDSSDIAIEFRQNSHSPYIDTCSVSGTTPTCGATGNSITSDASNYDFAAVLDSTDVAVTYVDDVNSPNTPTVAIVSLKKTTTHPSIIIYRQ